MLPALPTGMASTSGARPRSSQISKARGLLALEAERVDRVDQRDRVVVLLGQRPDDPERLVEVAVDGDDPRAGDERLEQLADRDLARRQDDDDLEPGGRAVGRGRGRGVAGRGADDRPGAVLERLGDGHDHAPVLERAGRVLALDLEVQVGEARAPRPSRSRVDERREPLAEGQRRGRVGDRQEARGSARRGAGGRCAGGRRGSSSRSVVDRVARRPTGAVDGLGRVGPDRDRGALDAADGGRRPQVEPSAAGDRDQVAEDGRRASAAPPAPGPSKPTRPTGAASTSIRLRTPSRPAERRSRRAARSAATAAVDRSPSLGEAASSRRAG